MSEPSLLGVPVRTVFDAVHPGMPAAIHLSKPLALTAPRVRWLRQLGCADVLTRKALCRPGGAPPDSYRTWYPMVEHGLIEATFDHAGWSFRITAKGRNALEYVGSAT